MSCTLNSKLMFLLFASLAGVGCGQTPSPFALQFAAALNGTAATCDQELTGLGPTKQHAVGVNDLRFYVSNLQFKNSAGEPVALTLDSNEFQLNLDSGSVALIDLMGNSSGSCAPTAVAAAEGTARTNSVVSGTTLVDEVAAISFDVGVPQAVMKSVIGVNTPEGAPSPMSEMYWSWASGYRHFVFNFAVRDAMNSTGDGYLHIGSRNCGPPAGRALSDRAACEFLNTPQFSAPQFNLKTNKVSVDIGALLAGLDFVAPIYDPKTQMVIGQGVGVQCHSSPSQPDCPAVFSGLGVDPGTGVAQAAGNRVFVVR
ncbi:MAG TPA: metallo-mystery pair system four-Cys motif protein [Pseudomonadota bacterium]|nr:metallo-mystery pair system four-Cys motif protein [Pseudomonadota bacterium]